MLDNNFLDKSQLLKVLKVSKRLIYVKRDLCSSYSAVTKIQRHWMTTASCTQPEKSNTLECHNEKSKATLP